MTTIIINEKEVCFTGSDVATRQIQESNLTEDQSNKLVKYLLDGGDAIGEKVTRCPDDGVLVVLCQAHYDAECQVQAGDGPRLTIRRTQLGCYLTQLVGVNKGK